MDTGIGISPDELPSIFEEFYQARQTGEMRKEGLGLGLSIVRRVADLLELRVEVDSAPGKGSRFTLSVPRGTVAAMRSTTVPAAQVPTRPNGEPIVLVVDDDAVASSTALLLEVEGYRPITAGHFDGAAERLSHLERAPDVIICDYQLSAGPNGIETIQMIRRATRRAIPAINGDKLLDLLKDAIEQSE